MSRRIAARGECGDRDGVHKWKGLVKNMCERPMDTDKDNGVGNDCWSEDCEGQRRVKWGKLGQL